MSENRPMSIVEIITLRASFEAQYFTRFSADPEYARILAAQASGRSDYTSDLVSADISEP